MKQKTQKKVEYIIEVLVPVCYDDGSEWHNTYYMIEHKKMDVKTDEDAQVDFVINSTFYEKESCRHGRISNPQRIFKNVYEKTEDGFERSQKIEVSVPRSEKCPCGKIFWPIIAEKACHKSLHA
ncbi:MAG: hypothetical protein WDZ40_00820 [Candidatus Spechtbacterales bacterium]